MRVVQLLDISFFLKSPFASFALPNEYKNQKI